MKIVPTVSHRVRGGLPRPRLGLSALLAILILSGCAEDVPGDGLDSANDDDRSLSSTDAQAFPNTEAAAYGSEGAPPPPSTQADPATEVFPTGVGIEVPDSDPCALLRQATGDSLISSVIGGTPTDFTSYPWTPAAAADGGGFATRCVLSTAQQDLNAADHQAKGVIDFRIRTRAEAALVGDLAADGALVWEAGGIQFSVIVTPLGGGDGSAGAQDLADAITTHLS